MQPGADDLEGVLDKALGAWPAIRTDVRQMLAERLADPRAVHHAVELCLACACAVNDAQAAAAFEQQYGSVIRAALLRSAPSELVDDLYQLTLAKLLVGDGAKPPAIGSYRGQSKLSTWVFVVARRLALKHLRTLDPSIVAGGSDVVAAIADRAAGGDALLAELKRGYRRAFHDAFRAALERRCAARASTARPARCSASGSRSATTRSKARWRSSAASSK
jgi:RNA polymerase sigma-70 factor